MAPFATDAKHLARLGVPAYGFSPLGLEPGERFLDRFHAVDERVGARRAPLGAPRPVRRGRRLLRLSARREPPQPAAASSSSAGTRLERHPLVALRAAEDPAQAPGALRVVVGRVVRPALLDHLRPAAVLVAVLDRGTASRTTPGPSGILVAGGTCRVDCARRPTGVRSVGAAQDRRSGAAAHEPAAPADRVGRQRRDPHRDQRPLAAGHRPDGGQELLGARPVDHPQHGLAARREPDGPQPAVVLLAAALDEPPLDEPVDEPRRRRRRAPDRLGEVGDRRRGALREDVQRGELREAEVELAELVARTRRRARATAPGPSRPARRSGGRSGSACRPRRPGPTGPPRRPAR